MAKAIVDAIQMKDPYTKGHSERVRRYSLLLARELGTPPEFRRRCHISAVLHDVGKIGMPDRLLFNTDELTADERREVQYHPVRGAEFLQKIPALHDVIDGVKYHHENWDGTGYPDKLKGEAIPPRPHDGRRLRARAAHRGPPAGNRVTGTRPRGGGFKGRRDPR